MTDDTDIDFGDLDVPEPYRKMLDEMNAGEAEVSALLGDAITQTYRQWLNQQRGERKQ